MTTSSLGDMIWYDLSFVQGLGQLKSWLSAWQDLESPSRHLWVCRGGCFQRVLIEIHPERRWHHLVRWDSGWLQGGSQLGTSIRFSASWMDTLWQPPHVHTTIPAYHDGFTSIPEWFGSNRPYSFKSPLSDILSHWWEKKLIHCLLLSKILY